MRRRFPGASGRHRRRGAVLVAILILLVVMTIVGVTTIGSVTTSRRQVGSLRTRISAAYTAETAMEQALLRLRRIAREGDGVFGTPQDFFNRLCAPPGPGGDTMPLACSRPDEIDPPCPDGAPGEEGKDSVTQNVICNFLGAAAPAGRVVVVRRNDFTDDAGNRFAQLLINSVAYGTERRRKILQGGVLVKVAWDGTSGTYRVDRAWLEPLPGQFAQILFARRWLSD